MGYTPLGFRTHKIPNLRPNHRLNSQSSFQLNSRRQVKGRDETRWVGFYFLRVSVNRERRPPDDFSAVEGGASTGACPAASVESDGARGTSPRSGVSSSPSPAEWEVVSPVVGWSRAGAFSSRRDKTRSEVASSATDASAAASASGSSSWGFSFFSTWILARV